MNQEFFDEKFIHLINKHEQLEESIERFNAKVSNDINNGYIMIDGYKIDFSDRIIEDCFFIKMPNDFKRMEDLYARLKYPNYNKKEKIIYTNERTTINLLFDIRNYNMAQDETERARDQMLEVILKFQPQAILMNKEKIDFKDGYAECFELITPALDSKIYNLVFVFEIYGKLMMGTFNCLETEMHNWVDIAHQMVASIQKT